MPIMDENDVSLPKATLSKMIREFMPADLRLAGDTMDMLIECCTEFVSLVSSESNDVSNCEKRNTIHPEHVLRALRELGLQEFVKEVTNTWEAWKEESKCTHKPGNRKTAADAAGLTEEEQIALQQQLFAAARRSFQLPEVNSEAGLSPGVTAPDGTSFPTPEHGAHPGVLQSHNYLGHPMMPPAVQSGGFAHLPQYPAQGPQLGGVYPSHLYGYPTTGAEGQMIPPHAADAKPEVMDPRGQSAGGVYYATQGGNVANEPAEPASRYGADVLPIPPLQVQPIPSAFHPAASDSRLSGPSLLPGSHPQSSISNQGAPQQSASTPPQQAGQPMFLMRPAAFVSPSAPAEPAGNVQTVWTHAVPQGLPELQLSQPVVVIHNGVQHLIPLQTLLSQVGGLQQFRVGPAPQQQQQQSGSSAKPEDPRCPAQAEVQVSTGQAANNAAPQQQEKEEDRPVTKFAEPSLDSTSNRANGGMEEGSSQPDSRDGSTGIARSGQGLGESSAEVPAMPLQPTQPMLVPLGLMGVSPKTDPHGAVASMERMFETSPSTARVPLEPFQAGGTLVSRGPIGEIPPLNAMTMMPPAIIGHSASPPGPPPPRPHHHNGSFSGAVPSAPHPCIPSSPQGPTAARLNTATGNPACVGSNPRVTTGINGSGAANHQIASDMGASPAPPRIPAEGRIPADVMAVDEKPKQGLKRGREGGDARAGGGDRVAPGDGSAEEDRQKHVRRRISTGNDADLPVSDVNVVDRSVGELSRDITNPPPSMGSGFARKENGCDVVGRVEQQR
ncbi:hypothetical protein BSKO_02130 [Bryopsis sp. KO-2023]|nr:hypothetical protein BSKO_02130 [Bryopsis sp. KO-2023]